MIEENEVLFLPGHKDFTTYLKSTVLFTTRPKSAISFNKNGFNYESNLNANNLDSTRTLSYFFSVVTNSNTKLKNIDTF